MNLFEQVDGRITYNPSTIQAIRDLKAGEELTIGGWLIDAVAVGFKDSFVGPVLPELFEAIQSSPGTITLEVPSDQVSRVDEVWPGDGWSRDVPPLKYAEVLPNVRLCLLENEADESKSVGEVFDQSVLLLHKFRSLSPICGGLLVKVGDGEPVKW